MESVAKMDSGPEFVRRVQFGDVDFISEQLSIRALTPQDCDRLSLLHWAAVNNRAKIARLLLNYGCSVNYPGGELKETPLQWAVRNDNFTQMIKLLLEYGADVHHKNINGHDALSISCMIGNVHMCYILLMNGSLAETADLDGNTALHCLLHCEHNDHDTKRRILRLLLNFGADTRTENADKNTALHKLFLSAGASEVDLVLAYYICESKREHSHRQWFGSDPSISRFMNAGNALGQTAFDIAKKGGNPANVRFFLDYCVHRSIPRMSVNVMFALLMWSNYWFLRLTGSYIYGFLGSGLVWFLIGDPLSLKSIVKDNSRRSNGWAWGIIITVVFAHFQHVASRCSSRVNIAICVLAVIIAVTLTLSTVIPPQSLGFDRHRNRLLSRVYRSGISEGPARRRDLALVNSNGSSKLHPAATDSESAGLLEGSAGGGADGNGSASEEDDGDYPDGLSSGVINPGKEEFKLCCSCLADRSLASTHCSRCDHCMVLLDHHCEFVDNCVGLGNRRVFFWFTFSASFGCAFACLCALRSIAEMYAESSSIPLNTLLDWISACWMGLWEANCELVYSTALAAFSALWIGFLAQGQLQLVAAETTTFEVLRGHHDGLFSMCTSKAFLNVVNFLLTGNYRVGRPDRCKRGVQVFGNFNDAMQSIQAQDRNDKLQIV